MAIVKEGYSLILVMFATGLLLIFFGFWPPQLFLFCLLYFLCIFSEIQI